MSLLQEVQQYLTQILDESGASITPADKIVTAVSGGPDSLTLLHLLAKRGLHPAENIIVVHLDHQLRPSSTEEAGQVSHIAAEWGVTCRVKQVEVTSLAQREGLSLEEAGRQARYRFFAEIAAEFNARVIFTGHHAGDQVETVLMHILRGSGSAGLRGILPASPLSGHPGCWLVRPLLNTSREQIEAYCQRHQLEPLIDETNTDTTFFRNRLRHELLPVLADYNPQIQARLQAMAAVTAADYEWLQQQTAAAWEKICLEQGVGWIRLALAAWQQLPLSLRRSTLRLAVGQLRPNLRDVGFQSIEQARRVGEKGSVGSEATLPELMVLSVGYSALTLRTAEAEIPVPQQPQLLTDEPLILPIPGTLPLANGWNLQCEILSKLEPRIILHNHDPLVAYVAIGENDVLVVRSRLTGERFQPFGLIGHTRSVKAVMIDRKIPAELRPRWPIVASDHLIWIAGHMMDERARVSPKSLRALKLSLTRRSQAFPT
jgi:tRNA(Ile)-lysidine synthase